MNLTDGDIWCIDHVIVDKLSEFCEPNLGHFHIGGDRQPSLSSGISQGFSEFVEESMTRVPLKVVLVVREVAPKHQVCTVMGKTAEGDLGVSSTSTAKPGDEDDESRRVVSVS